MKYLKRFICLLLVLVSVFNTTGSVAYAAMSADQKRIFGADIGYHNLDDDGNCTNAETVAASGGSYTVPAEWGVRGKLAQMLMISVTYESEVQGLLDNHVGGVFLQKRQFTQADARWINRFYSETTIPPIVAADEEGGRVQRIRDLNAMPSAKVMGTLTDVQVAQIAAKQAYLLRTMGVRMAFAPVVDLDGGSSVIGGIDRAFSRNPDVVAAKAGAFADGYRQTGIIPTFKHFPGHGRADGDSHVSAVTTPPLNAMRQLDLKPYETVLQKGDSAVMVGHLTVPGLAENGLPTSLSPRTYQLLRNEYRFEGVALTDDIGEMQAIRDQYGIPTAASLAIQAGADMVTIVGPQTVGAVLNQLEADYKAGKITDERINQSLTRIGALRTNFGLNTGGTADTNNNGGTGGVPARQGGDNRETAYNFFISKGLSPHIAAGFVGNLVQESGVNPKSVNGIGATGIAQWLGGRKQNLLKKPNYQDLMVQLEFIWEELNGAEKNAYNKIKAAVGLAAATYAVRKFYERPGESEANDKRRLFEAAKALEQFGNGTGAVPALLTDTGGSNYCGRLSLQGSQNFNQNFKLYSQGDPRWASAPYSTSTIKASGCGPTSLAMVITNLTGQEVLPPEVANWSVANGYYDGANGTSWGLFDKGPANWGLKSKMIDASQITQTLQQGGLVIVSGLGAIPFSDNGHILVIRGVDENGKYLLGNPAFAASNNRSWDLSEMRTIRGLWAVTK